MTIVENDRWIVSKEKLLNRFEKSVKLKLYKKIDYKVWREINNANSDRVIIKKIYDYPHHRISLETTGVYGGIYYFEIHDNSLGEFLNNNFKQNHELDYDKPPKPTEAPNETINIPNSELTYASDGNIYLTDENGDKILVHNLNDISVGSTLNHPEEKNMVYTTPTGGYIDNYLQAGINTASSAFSGLAETVNDLIEQYHKNENENKNKENKKMDTSNLFKFDFGPASGNLFRMSPYGLAVKTQSNSWIAYNAKTGELMDVEIVNFDISKMIYRMPVALNAIKPGDILMHAGKPVFVKEIAAGGNTARVINYADATVVDILPVKSPFGFNFFTKVTPLFDFSNLGANSDNPFGNMLPFLMLSGESSGDFDPTLLFLASSMSGSMDFTSNPMMLYFLMNRKDKGDILPFLMMMNGGNFGMAPISTPAPVTTLK